MTLQRAAHSDWPHLLLPEVGKLPPAATWNRLERTLHVALNTATERQPGLERALRSISDRYVQIDWVLLEAQRSLVNHLLSAAADLRPTLVFMQLQRAVSGITSETIQRLRRASDANVVIINWDGDQHYEPDSPERRWFCNLGQACDSSLVVNTDHPRRYAELGVRHAGYLQIGIDDHLYRPVPSSKSVPVVFLASHYPIPAYRRRNTLVEKLSRKLGNKFCVYGNGWRTVANHPMLRQSDEAGVYNSSRCAISMSIRNDLSRYTSDRLFRGLASGAVMLVESFPDLTGLGLVDGENVFVWRTHAELEQRIQALLANATPRTAELRRNAVQLGQGLHSWKTRMSELAAIVAAVRNTHVCSK